MRPIHCIGLSGVLLLSVACTTSVRRAALVPHQHPVARSGQPMGQNNIELAAGTAVVAEGTEPTEASGANAGIALPRWQVEGALRGRLTKNLDVGFIMDRGFDKGSRGLADDQPDPDAGDVYGYGASFFYSAEISPTFNLGLGADMLFYSIPYVEYQTCASNCLGIPWTIVDHDRDTIGVMSLAVIPSWRVRKDIVVFAGASFRNHPTIDKSEVVVGPDFDSTEVEAGPMNAVLSGGAELELPNGVRGMVYIHQTIGGPVDYGPTLGFNVAIPLSRSKPAPPRPAYPPPPAGYAARD